MTSSPHSMQDDLRKLIADWEDLGPVEQERYAVGYADQAIGMLEGLFEQNEDLRDLLRGFLYDADNGDRPGPGLRDAARKALDG